VPYCTGPGATALLRTDALRELEGSPWSGYDPDGDGLPNLARLEGDARMPFYVGVRPKVTRADLRPGDTIMFNMKSGAGQESLPVLLPFFFVTVPALKEYGSGLAAGQISYPAASETPGSRPDNPIVLDDASLTLTFWKPQREAIEGAESGAYIDIGHLEYKLSMFASGSQEVIWCQPGDFSNLSSTLEPRTTPMGYASAKDTADDVPYEEGHPLSLTVNVQQCLARHGVGGPGQRFGIDINADSQAGDQTSQTVYFQLKEGS
jgi:hypothetical protein